MRFLFSIFPVFLLSMQSLSHSDHKQNFIVRFFISWFSIFNKIESCANISNNTYFYSITVQNVKRGTELLKCSIKIDL